MIDPGLDAALQRAVLAALRANGNLLAAGNPPIGQPPNDRIYDRVPPINGSALYPYITIGDDTIADDRSDCFDSSMCIITVHVWSRAVGKAEAKLLGGQVRVALDKLISIDGHATVAGGFETAIYRAGQDMLEIEGVLLFRYLVDSLV